MGKKQTKIEKRQTTEKAQFVETLKEMPIIFTACRKVGISRATYYRWHRGDKEFRRQADDAIAEGTEFINDIATSQLMKLMKKPSMGSISFWLKHNHETYGAKRTVRSRNHGVEELAEEEQTIVLEALTLVTSNVIRHGKKKKIN